MDSQRGKIINRDAAKQIRDFSLLCYGTITPTDIDGFIDINNRIFIFLELKYKNKELPYGQRLAYERLIDTCQIAKKISIGIIASHENDYHCDINVGNAKVY